MLTFHLGNIQFVVSTMSSDEVPVIVRFKLKVDQTDERVDNSLWDDNLKKNFSKLKQLES